MANLNVLPQVNAKPTSATGSVANGKEALKGSAQGAELAKEFQTNLTDAGQEKSTLAKQPQAAAVAEKAKQADELKAGLAEGKKAEIPAGQIQQNQTEVLKALQSSQKEASEKAQEAALQAGVNPQAMNVLAMPKGQAADVNSLKGKALNEAPVTSAKGQTPQKVDAKLESMMADKAAIQPQIQSLTQATRSANASEATQAASSAMNGVALNALSDEHAFDVEALDVKEGASSFDSGAEMKNKLASSKLSTADYLNLRDLSRQSAIAPAMAKDSISNQANLLQSPKLSNSLQASGVGLKAVTLGAKEDRKSTEGAENAPVISLNHQQNGFNAKVVDAPVTQGSNQKVILSHDAVHQITNQVNVLHQAKQDGEIKIRLRPDHLGELQMSVKTQGQAVSIQIKAQDGEAKKIIEESLGSLRDSLSQQNLNLSRVDIVTQPQHTAQSDSGMQLDLGQFRQNNDQQGFQGSEQGSRQDRYFEEDAKPVNLNASQASRLKPRSGLSNLDLIA